MKSLSELLNRFIRSVTDRFGETALVLLLVSGGLVGIFLPTFFDRFMRWLDLYYDAGLLTALVGTMVGLFGFGLSLALSKRTSSEATAATERDVATSADVLTRNFQTRINQVVENSVARLARDSDVIIKEKIADKIDQSIGNNLVEALGRKLAADTSSAYKTAMLRQFASDSFELMRSRALQYAASASRQSGFFRWAAILLAFLGLIALGLVLFSQRAAILTHPEMLDKRIDWPMLIMSNGPTYAFVLLCEFLALIMFRYQSKALEYMRYFSNEATNIDARRIGFLTTLDLLSKTTLEALVKKLEATERNFIISKDQRTLEIANNENEDRAIDRIQKLMIMSRDRDSATEPESGRRPNGKAVK